MYIILEAKKLASPDRNRQAEAREKKMKIYKTQQELEADIKDGLLKVDDDVKIECNININASIICWNLDCGYLYCQNLDCWDLDCMDLDCGDLNCGDLNCMDLNCGDLNCKDLNCGDLSYYAIAVAYYKFKCKSVVGRRNNSKHFCLDSEVIITGEGK